MAITSPRPNEPTPEELAAWLRLAFTQGIGHELRLTLLRELGPPEQVLAAGRGALAARVGPAAADALLRDDPELEAIVEAALAWRTQAGCSLVTLADPDYPQPLLDIPDPPLILFVRGRSLSVLNRPALAIVGSRHATVGGCETARAFATDLAGQGFTIVSGLATGIDAAAHEGALAAPCGTTLAVMGTGADRVYPAANHRLAHRISDRGALVSELPLGAPPLRHHFPRRNRLIAALCRGVLVVEAARQSGSLITARLAAEAGREVFAIPGSIHSPQSRGCHQLIRQGAKLVESAQDILEELPGASPSGSPPPRPDPDDGKDAGAEGSPLPPVPAEEPDDPLLHAMGWAPVSVDSLILSGAIQEGKLAEALLRHELAGRVARLPDGRFQRLGTPKARGRG